MIRLAALVLFASTSVMSAAATPNPPSSVAVAPKAYVVIEIAVTDRANYENYKKAIEPIILVFMGLVIATLLYAFYLPLFQLTSVGQQ